MTKDEALRILLGGKHYDSVEECQAELAEMADMISKMTEVVMCKDCVYVKDFYNDGTIYCCRPGEMRWHGNDPNWFCADGERKEGEQGDTKRTD